MTSLSLVHVVNGKNNNSKKCPVTLHSQAGKLSLQRVQRRKIGCLLELWLGTVRHLTDGSGCLHPLLCHSAEIALQMFWHFWKNWTLPLFVCWAEREHGGWGRCRNILFHSCGCQIMLSHCRDDRTPWWKLNTKLWDRKNYMWFDCFIGLNKIKRPLKLSSFSDFTF